MSEDKNVSSELTRLRTRFPRPGTVRWLGVRPSRDEAMITAATVEARIGGGLTGDRFSGRRSDARAVTLIQHEHLGVIAALLGQEVVDPAWLRRNIVVSGLNLVAAKEVHLHLGEAIVEMTGLCHPCSKMETRLGPGAYNAMRGHGGITARVIRGGRISVGAPVRAGPALRDDIRTPLPLPTSLPRC